MAMVPASASPILRCDVRFLHRLNWTRAKWFVEHWGTFECLLALVRRRLLATSARVPPPVLLRCPDSSVLGIHVCKRVGDWSLCHLRLDEETSRTIAFYLSNHGGERRPGSVTLGREHAILSPTLAGPIGLICITWIPCRLPSG